MCSRQFLGLLTGLSIIASHNATGTASGAPTKEIEPEFTDPISNVTVALGREAVLTCAVISLGQYKVGWLRASDQMVLALQDRIITHNVRFTVSRQDNNKWQLKIRQIKELDRGCYICQINTRPMRQQTGCVEVQVPPDILDQDTSSDVTVQEGQDASLYCGASGIPKPRVTWKKEDGSALLLRTNARDFIKVDSYNGTMLSLLRVERRQMGAYLCIASNDVPPAVSKRVTLNVHFPPSVRAPSQLLGAPLDSDVQLECLVEASPVAVTYWLKGRIGSQEQPHSQNDIASGLMQQKPDMLLDGSNHMISEQQLSQYQSKMLLTVRELSKRDLGTYSCVCTNSLGHSEATVRVYEIKLATKSPASLVHRTNNPQRTTTTSRRTHLLESTTFIYGHQQQEATTQADLATKLGYPTDNEVSCASHITNNKIYLSILQYQLNIALSFAIFYTDNYIS